MSKTCDDRRRDFEQAMGESFGQFVSPPVPFEDASPHECCEVVWGVAGRNVTPADLSALAKFRVVELSFGFGTYFDCDPPAVEQIQSAIANTLVRWPVGSLGETA